MAEVGQSEASTEVIHVVFNSTISDLKTQGSQKIPAGLKTVLEMLTYSKLSD